MVFTIIAIVTGHLPRIGKRCDGRAPAGEPIRNGPPTGRDGLMDLNCRDAFPAGNSLPFDMVGNFLRGRAITPSRRDRSSISRSSPAVLGKIAQHKGADPAAIEVWFADEAGSDRRTRRGTRPATPSDQPPLPLTSSEPSALRLPKLKRSSCLDILDHRCDAVE
jgi:hypothetical protein